MICLSFGAVADFTKTSQHNVNIMLAQMPSWFYFDRPQNLVYHNLCDTKVPPCNLYSLLGLGLKFCPSPCYTTYNIKNMLRQFCHDLCLKTYYASKPDDGHNDPWLHVKITWTLPWWDIPYHVWNRLTRFE